MTKKYNIAVVGATGLVGEMVLKLLYERNFPIDHLYPLASENSVGEIVAFGDTELTVSALDDFDFSTADFAFFAVVSDISLKYAPIAAKAGCTVIDKSTAFRYEKDIPLVIPEVNPDALKNYKKRNIIANPNCTTIPILIAVKPILDFYGVTRMNIATYQSVSGAGKAGIEALATETAALLNGQSMEGRFALGKQIAFNVLPKIDGFQENGYTLEEMKLVWESKKILNDDKILINPTAVRVPVFFGHSAALHCETKKHADAQEIRELLQKIPEIKVIDHNDYPTAVTDAADHDAVFVGRIRNDISHPNGINLWIISDNIRKGAALNAIQIAEMLIATNFN